MGDGVRGRVAEAIKDRGGRGRGLSSGGRQGELEVGD